LHVVLFSDGNVHEGKPSQEMRNLSNLFNSETQKGYFFVRLWHFHKVINIANTSISKNHHLV